MARPAHEPRTVPLYTLIIPPVLILIIVVISGQLPDGKLHVWFLDVGQGDAIMIKTPGGRTALVDGGPGPTDVLNGIGAYVSFYQRDLDLMMLTHPHDDHMAGLPDVLSRYRVGQVAQTVFTGTNGVRGEWLSRLAQQGTPVYYPGRGDRITFAGEPDISLQVLNPPTPAAISDRQGNDVNNAGLVVRLDYGRHRILLTGDAQVESEQSISQALPGDLPSTVLKVGHHGSDTSSTPAFLSKVRPTVAIISVGTDNRYNHPSDETLRNLQAVGAKIYRTDRNGTIEIITDKEQMWVRSER